MGEGRRDPQRAIAPEAPSAGLMELTRRSETLHERLARLAGTAPEPLSEDRVQKLLAPWSKAFARGGYRALRRRLAWDGWTPEQAAAALLPAAGPDPAPAPWTAELERYAGEARALAAELAGGAGEELGHRRPQAASVPFFELWLPWVRAAAAALAASAEGTLAELARPAVADLEAELLADVARLSELAAYELFEARRSAAPAAGLYREFVAACLADPLQRLYQPFPVLARQTAETVRQWRQMVLELARRLAADRPQITATFGAGQPPGAVRAVRAGLSDRHRDGRQVLILEFESGLRLVYKPRCVDLELALGRWLEWCAAEGLEECPRAPRVLPREGYGWQEFVAQDRLDSREEAGRYYRRAGALAAFAYVLQAHDLHAENLVATRDGPVIVDAEMFLQPVPARWSTAAAVHDAEGSCLDSGLLTQPERGAGGESRELGGLRAAPRHLGSGSGRRWRHVNSDRMTVEPGELWEEPRDNAVWIGPELAPPEEFRDQLADGFERAYRFLVDRRDALLADDGALAVFRGARVRILFRRSQDYWNVLALAALPRHQRSGLSASLLREALLSVFAASESRPLLWPLVAEERTALERRDVPYFALAAEASVLPSAARDEVPGYLACSGLSAVRESIARLGETDLASQLELLRLALTPPVRLTCLKAAEHLRPAAALAARELGAHSMKLAFDLGEELLERFPAARLPEVWALGHGRLGTALFYAALAHESGEARFGEAARDLVRPLGRAPSPPAAAVRQLGLGGFSGLGSLLYGLTWLGRLLDEKRFLALARGAARLIDAEKIRADRAHDLEGGAAGALLGLLALAETTGEEEALRSAGACGEHLLARQELFASDAAAWRNDGGVALAGWAHGAAGIARALAALGEASGDARYRAAAAAALGYERILYDRGRRNWPVLALEYRGGRAQRGWMIAWCHGAPGIALSRLLLPSTFADPQLADELEAALATTAAAPANRLDHLCCGTLGRSAVLLTAGHRLGSEEHLRASRGLAAGVLDRALADGSFRLRADPFENRELDPGFLKGLAGIGYHLLRLAGSADLPDVLALELPDERRSRLEADR